MSLIKDRLALLFVLFLYFCCGGWYVYGSIPEGAEED